MCQSRPRVRPLHDGLMRKSPGRAATGGRGARRRAGGGAASQAPGAVSSAGPPSSECPRRPLRRRGRTGPPAEALAAARQAMEVLGSAGRDRPGEARLPLFHVGPSMRSAIRGRPAAALADARAGLRARAGKISDPELRRSFLERVHENARILKLSQQWLRHCTDHDPSARIARWASRGAALARAALPGAPMLNGRTPGRARPAAELALAFVVPAW